MDEYGTKPHISFVSKQFALFLRNPSVCGRVLLYLYYLLPPVFLALCNGLLVIFTFIIGVFSDNVMEQYWGNDPRTVVIDEFMGTWIATLSALFCYGDDSRPIIYASISFILFRIIDIWKLLGCRWADQNIHGGLGCMLDDVLAGAYAIIITLIIRYSQIIDFI